MQINALPVVKDERYWVEWHLDNWARWERYGGLPEGLPDRSLVLEGYTTYDSNSEGAYERLDAWSADATNAVIEDLVPAEKAAIHHRYLFAVYRFQRDNYHELLESAKTNIAAGLRVKGIWMGE